MKKVTCIISLLFITAISCAQPVEEKIDALLTAYAKTNKLNGTVLVAQKGEIIYQKGFGYKDTDAKQANDINSIFQTGSLTKQFTAAVIMQLQQEKKLAVMDKLSKYFPEFPNADRITIEHLLTHTSGLFNYTNDPVIMKSDVSKSQSQKELIAVFTKYKPDFEPGTKWNYSNTAYSLLGYIIEKVTKQTYEMAVRKRILQPLGMNNSGFDFTHLKHPNKARGYFAIADSVIKAPIVDSTIAYSAGALYSTVGDLYKWERAIYTNKILRPDSWKAVFTPFKNKYGYGWSVDTLYEKQFTSHSGGIHGFASYLLRFPQEELVVIVLDNSSSRSLSQISRSLAAIVLNQPYEIPVVSREIRAPVSVLQQYVGEYQLAPNFSIVVSLNGDQLRAQATGQEAFDLYAEKENLFFLKAVEAKVEFVKDGEGKVTEMILYQNGMTPRGKKIK